MTIGGQSKISLSQVQRTSKTINGVTIYYVYDEQGNLLSELDSSGNSIKDYIYLEGEYVAHVEQTGDTGSSETLEQVFYPLNNHLGQPEMMVRADIHLGHELYTDPFGKMHAMYINASLGTGPEAQNLRLPGQYYDAETGLHYNHYRYYDASRGQYNSPDPRGILLDFSEPERQMAAMMGIGIPEHPGMGYVNHSYNYVDSNPVNTVDPTGESIVIPLNMPSLPGNNSGGSATSPHETSCEAKCWANWGKGVADNTWQWAPIGRAVSAASKVIGVGADLAAHGYSGYGWGSGSYNLGKCLHECKECEKK